MKKYFSGKYLFSRKNKKSEKTLLLAEA